jgi:hypothetical protein
MYRPVLHTDLRNILPGLDRHRLVHDNLKNWVKGMMGYSVLLILFRGQLKMRTTEYVIMESSGQYLRNPVTHLEGPLFEPGGRIS